MNKNKFKQYKKKSGILIPVSLKNQIPFKTKRIFLIYGKKNFVRGDHAHYKCSQFLIPIYGKIEVFYENKLEKKTVILNHKSPKGILLKPKTWCKIKFLNKNDILMVFCDREYEFSDYIESYASFLKVKKK